MALSDDALLKRKEALSLRLSRQLGLHGEHWGYVVTRDGQEVYRSLKSGSLGFLGSSIFLHGIFGGSFSLWLVGEIYINGIRTKYAWSRVKFRTTVKTAGTEITPNNQDPLAFPSTVKNIRARLYPTGNRGRNLRVRPTRSSTLRPSPETKTVQSIRCRNRDGVFLSLTTTPIQTYTRTWSGTRTPNFSRKKRRALPVNPHSVLIWQQTAEPQYRSEVYLPTGELNWWLEAFGDPASLGLPGSISHIESARFQAIRRIIDRSENGIEGNVAQDITQLGQVNRTINDAVTRITKAIKYTKQRNLNGAVNVLVSGKPTRTEFFPPSLRKQVSARGLNGLSGSVAENWLAIQYGWKPLLHDIDGAMRSLAYFNHASYHVRQVKGSGKAVSVTVTPIVDNGGKFGTLHTTVESRTKIGLRYRLDDRLTAFFSQTGFTNPINLLWEVLPYSFVVDWFLPIGPYLETLGAWDGLVFIDGFQTQFTRKRHQAVTKESRKDGNYFRTRDGDYEAEGIRLDRTKLTTFPAAVFPSFKNPLSVDHVLNGIALMRAAFK